MDFCVRGGKCVCVYVRVCVCVCVRARACVRVHARVRDIKNLSLCHAVLMWVHIILTTNIDYFPEQP